MSCNVGTKLFTFMTVFIIAGMVLLVQTDIGHCQWHVGQDVMQEFMAVLLKQPMLAHHQILLQDWHTKINFGLNIYHDSAVTNGIDKIVMRRVQLVYWIPLFYVVGRFVCPLKLEETENSTNANPNFPAHHFSKNRPQRTKTSSQLHRLNCIYWKVHHLSAMNTDWHYCTNHSHISDISSWFTLPCSILWSNDSSVLNGIDKIVMRHVQAAFAPQPDWLSHYCRSLKDEYPW